VARKGGLTGCCYGLLREGLHGNGLVALRVDELVVHDGDAGVIRRQHRDLIGNRLRVAERRNLLAHTREAQLDLLGVTAAQLCLALFADDHEVRVWLVREQAARGAGHARVNTAAEALVGGAHDDEDFLVGFAVESLRLGFFEDRIGGLAVGTGFGHGLLGAGEFGGCDDFHGFCDFFNVADGFEAVLDFAEGGV